MNARTRAALLGLALAHLVRPPLGAAAEAASTLVMPFDATAGSVSFLAVNHRRPAGDADSAALRTHWTFWGEDCSPLLDFSLCLPDAGGVVVDPTAVPGAGPGGDLSGLRGFVTVTAYETEGGCDPAKAAGTTLARGTLLGTFTLASLESGAAFGGDAIAVPGDPAGLFADLPGDPGTHQSALRLQSFAPVRLEVSRIVLLALRERRGVGGHRASELGPAGSSSVPVRATVRFTDNAGFEVPLPELRFGCALFASLRADDPDALLSPEVAAELSAGGVLEIEAPHADGEPLGGTSWLYGFHGQALGTFGVLAVAHSESTAARAPTPPATATPQPSVQATSTTVPTPSVGATPLGPPTLVPSPAASGSPATPAATLTPGAATPTPTPGGINPTPAPIASGATPTPLRTGGATSTPGAALTPTPGSGITPTPSPSVTPAPTAPSGSTPTAPPAFTPPPPRTPTPIAPPACTNLSVEIRSSYGPGGSNVAGVVATLGYPQASVAIPGTASAASVLARVTNVSGASGLFQVVDRDTSGDGVDDTLRIGLVSVSTAIPAGPLARVRFDCTDGAAPAATAFGCALEASTLEGDLLSGATCTVEVLP